MSEQATRRRRASLARQVLAGLTATGVLAVAGCAGTAEATSGSQGTVTIAVNPWIGYEANAAVVSTILETRLGYRVELKKLTAKESWPALESGAVDVILENWGHAAEKKSYIQEKGVAASAGLTGNKGVIGLYVPSWMAQDYPDILDWRNLNKYAHLFATANSAGRGQILDGDKSYVTNDAALVRNLGLNFTVAFSGSEQATIDAALAAARDRKPLLFYFWQPHWLFQKHRFAKINFPEHTPGCDADPEAVTCDYPVDDIDKIVSRKFADSGNSAYTFIKNFSWTNADQNEVADYLANEKLSYRAAAEKWMDSHPDHDSTIKHRCHVLMDELTALQPMRSIAKANGFARGFWLHFSFVVQTKTDLRDEYKEDGLASLLGNLGAEIVFGTNDELLTKEVSERVGYDTVANVSRSAPRFFGWFRAKEQNENTGQAKRALLLPQEVNELPDDEEIMFRKGAPAFRLKRNCWYDDPNFATLEQTPVEPPPVTYKLDRDDGSVRFPTEKTEKAGKAA